MSKSLTESLINEGIRALREFNISGLGMQQSSPVRQARNFFRNRTGGTPVGKTGVKLNRGLNNIGNNLSDIVARSKEAIQSKGMKRVPRKIKDRGMRNATLRPDFPGRAN